MLVVRVHADGPRLVVLLVVVEGVPPGQLVDSEEHVPLSLHILAHDPVQVADEVGAKGDAQGAHARHDRLPLRLRQLGRVVDRKDAQPLGVIHCRGILQGHAPQWTVF